MNVGMGIGMGCLEFEGVEGPHTGHESGLLRVSTSRAATR